MVPSRYLVLSSLFITGIWLFWNGGNPIVQQQFLRHQSDDWVSHVDSMILHSIEQSQCAGAVVFVSRYGELEMHRAYGHARKYAFEGELLPTAQEMTVDHCFDVASLTKVFATTFGVMLLFDEGRVDLDAPLYRYLPQFRGPAKDSISLRHLLTHTAGLYPWKPVYYHARDAQGSFDYIKHLPLAYPVGKERHYSDLGFMLLGYMIEAVTKKPLDVFLQERLYQPLGLMRTFFRPLVEQGPFAATSHGNPFERTMVADDGFGFVCDEDPESFTNWRQYVLEGEVNDGNAWHAHQGLAGHAGLFSTAEELHVLMQVLLNGGQYHGRQFIRESTIDLFLVPDEFGSGLGWAMSSDLLPAESLPSGSFGHTGFTGTFALAVPSQGLALILLTNRQHGGVDESNNYPSLTHLRKQLVGVLLE